MEHEPPLDQSIWGTMKINPADYSPKMAHNRFEGAKYALAGLLYLVRRQQGIQLTLVISVITLSLAVWLALPLWQFLFVFMGLGLVWVTEAINSAIEAAIDLISPQIHPMAKVSKDVAAAATLIASCISLVLNLLLLLPPLWERFAGS